MPSTIITMGGYQPPSSVNNQACEEFGRGLESRLGEEIRFDFDGNMVSTRGLKATDLPDMVSRGELTMCYFASSYLTRHVPELAIFDVPFVVRDRTRAAAALDGKLGKEIAEKFREKSGLRVLAFWDNGFRHFTNGVHAIHSPADCAGLSIRSMNSELHQEFFRSLGFDPTFVDVADLVEAAKSGRIDAQENPLTNTYNFGTHHYHRHITLSAHLFGVILMLCHKDTFEAWPVPVRRAVEEAAAQATKVQRRLAAMEDDDILARLDPRENEVVRLSDKERAVFEEAVAPVVARQRERLGGSLFELLN